MQGAFPVNAEWPKVLDPDNDESVTRKVRSDNVARELARLARTRAPGPPPPNNPLLRYTQGPFPPTTHFKLLGLTIYVLKGTPPHELQELRLGQLGHYLVTTVVDNVGTNAVPVLRARPFIDPSQDQTFDARAILPKAPGTEVGDGRFPPNPQYCQPYRDYIPADESFYEIGRTVLSNALENAEALDLSFARRLEGLSNLPFQTCWDCIDPDYDPSDRPLLRDQFIAKYLSKFYEGNEPSELGPSAADVATEVMEKHRALCQAWARKHYRTLTPYVTSPAEALASDFYKFVEMYFPESRKLSRAELARVLMRHPETATDFAVCLYNFINSLEQSRAGRNASYKAMSATSAARVASYKRFGDLLSEKMGSLRAFFAETLADPHRSRFHPYLVDWHTILGQMPQVHRFFDSSGSSLFPAKRARNPAARDRVPPWKFGKT
jgi:hypothetical protein